MRLGRLTAPTAGVRLRAPTAGWQLGPDPVAEVSGHTAALALLLWRRTSLDDPRITVHGDRTAATALLGRPLTP